MGLGLSWGVKIGIFFELGGVPIRGDNLLAVEGATHSNALALVFVTRQENKMVT